MRAFITGISGMDGSHLADLLLSKGYEVHGLVRRSASGSCSLWRLAKILDKVKLHTGDLLDQGSLESALKLSKPDEVYNLAAQSFVKASFDAPLYTSDVTGLGTLRLLEAVRSVCCKAKVYQASSSEMFGEMENGFLNEDSPFKPRSPYGVAKLFAHHICQVYEKSYRMFISTGINFNHESERRGEEFVTRKITMAVARIKLELQEKLTLGNISTSRDWSYAPEVMEAAWLMLQQDSPGVFVISSGRNYSVMNFMEEAFRQAGIPEKMLTHVDVSSDHLRPSDVYSLCGNSTKARSVLGWEPKVGFVELVQRMVDNDVALIERDRSLQANGRSATD